MRAMVSPVVVVVVLSCGPTGHPVLELTLSPKSVGDATPVKVHVVGTNAAGGIGTGKVKITSAAGSLTTPVEVQLDSFGTATADLVCDPRVEADCTTPVKVSATWSSDKEVATAEAVLNSGGVSGSGGGVGSGGGSGTGGFGGGGSGGDPSRNCTRLADGGEPVEDIISVGGTVGSQGQVSFTVFGRSGGNITLVGFTLATGGLIVPPEPWADGVGLEIWAETMNVGVAKPGTNAGISGPRSPGEPPFIDFHINRVGIASIACPQGLGVGTFTVDELGPVGQFGLPAKHGSYAFDCPDAGISVSGCFRQRPY